MRVYIHVTKVAIQECAMYMASCFIIHADHALSPSGRVEFNVRETTITSNGDNADAIVFVVDDALLSLRLEGDTKTHRKYFYHTYLLLL